MLSLLRYGKKKGVKMDETEGIFELDYVSNSFDLFAKEIITLLQYEEQIVDFDEYITSSRLVGAPGAHPRESILSNIKKLVVKQQSGKDGDYNLNLPKMSFEETFNAAIKICGNTRDLSYTVGEDFVSLNAFKEGLQKAVSVAKDTAKNQGTVFIGSGHTESLLAAYALIGKALIEKGARLYNPAIQMLQSSNDDVVWLSSFCAVTTVTRDNKIIHTHGDFNIDKIIEKEGTKPDLAIADHGIAGATIRAGIPTIAIVDTNDIEILMACTAFPDRVFPVPIHDNAGLKRSRALAYCFNRLLND